MHNVSNRYCRIVQNPGRTFRYKASIDLANGETMKLDGHDIMLNGIMINHATSESNKLQVGNVTASRLDLQLNNFTKRFEGVDFVGAEIHIYIGLVVEQNHETGEVLEWTKNGLFTVETATAVGRVINIVGWDRNFNFEVPYKDSPLNYPATLRQILEECCRHCNVPLLTYDFDNADYVVAKRPESGAVTYRDVLAWVVELAGCYSRITPDGALELSWYDLEHPAVTIRDVTEMWAHDVSITGVKLKSHTEGEEKVYGEHGYVVDLTRNELVQQDMDALGQTLGRKLAGMTFRPFVYQGWSNPAVEAGDTAIIYDKEQRPYKTIVSRIYYQAGANERFSGDAEAYASRNRANFSAIDIVQEHGKNDTKNQISAYDTMAKQFSSMTANSMGFYQTTEKQDDGSEIWYQHDKPALEESKIIWKKSLDTMAVSTDGGKTWQGMDKNGNAVLNVLAAHGIVADWITTGRIEARTGGAYFDLDKGELSATKMISSSYPQYTASIGPSEQGDYGAWNLYDGKDCLMSVYKTYYTDGKPAGMVITAPHLTNSAGTNRKGVGIGDDGITVFADYNGEIFGVKIGSDKTIQMWGDISVNDNLVVFGNLRAWGTKTRIVNTSYGDVCLSAYETAEPMFGDIGESRTGEDGKVTIEIDPIFLETVNTDCVYQVFLQPYAEGHFRVTERASNYFAVAGPANSPFAWEIKVKQRGYEASRLEKYQQKATK